MSRDSRFDKLETERAGAPAQENARVAEERFSEAPEAKRAVEAQAPAMEAAIEASPLSADTAPQLKRFEADGANHLALDTDELVRLPFRRCAECQRDSSKFDRTCIFCQASLETPQARDLNLLILATYDETKEQEQTQLRAQHEANIKQIVEEEFKKHEKAEKEQRIQFRFGQRAGLVTAALLCFAISLWARSFCPSLFLFTTGLVLIILALPDDVRRGLTASVKPRWRL